MEEVVQLDGLAPFSTVGVSVSVGLLWGGLILHHVALPCVCHVAIHLLQLHHFIKHCNKQGATTF